MTETMMMMATTTIMVFMVMIPMVVNPSGGWSGQEVKSVRWVKSSDG